MCTFAKNKKFKALFSINMTSQAVSFTPSSFGENL